MARDYWSWASVSKTDSNMIYYLLINQVIIARRFKTMNRVPSDLIQLTITIDKSRASNLLVQISILSPKIEYIALTVI
jgi:hypothetical protein